MSISFSGVASWFQNVCSASKSLVSMLTKLDVALACKCVYAIRIASFFFFFWNCNHRCPIACRQSCDRNLKDGLNDFLLFFFEFCGKTTTNTTMMPPRSVNFLNSFNSCNAPFADDKRGMDTIPKSRRGLGDSFPGPSASSCSTWQSKCSLLESSITQRGKS